MLVGKSNSPIELYGMNWYKKAQYSVEEYQATPIPALGKDTSAPRDTGEIIEPLPDTPNASIKEGDEVNIKYEDLLVDMPELKSALSNISRGLPSMTDKLQEVFYYPNIDKFELVDGHHRLIESLYRGEDEAIFRVADVFNPDHEISLENRFNFNPSLPYGGVEEIVID